MGPSVLGSEEAHLAIHPLPFGESHPFRVGTHFSEPGIPGFSGELVKLVHYKKMIDKLFECLMGVMERVLALAFIFAVGLNFANVIGRYGMGRSILGADEVHIYIMVCMTFLVASVITWRKRHLRMDVLFQFFPSWFKPLLKAVEMVLFLLLSAFVLVQSSSYAAQMFIPDRRSDNAGVPM